MRVLSLLAFALILAVSALGQETSSKASSPSQGTTSVADQPPAHPITPAQIHELMELTGQNKVKSQVARAMWASIQQTFPPYMPKDVMDELESGLENLDIGPVQQNIYQKYISTEDAAQIIAFDKSPAGQRMIRVMPQMSKELLMGGEELGKQLAERVMSEHADEIKAAAVKYQQDHAAPPTVITPN